MSKTIKGIKFESGRSLLSPGSLTLLNPAFFTSSKVSGRTGGLFQRPSSGTASRVLPRFQPAILLLANLSRGVILTYLGCCFSPSPLPKWQKSFQCISLPLARPSQKRPTQPKPKRISCCSFAAEGGEYFDSLKRVEGCQDFSPGTQVPRIRHGFKDCCRCRSNLEIPWHCVSQLDRKCPGIFNVDVARAFCVLKNPGSRLSVFCVLGTY